MTKSVYLDNAATTALDKKVLEKMLPYFTDDYGNANSQHAFGRKAAAAVDGARDTIAALIGAKPSEIYFTSGGTEADNWAVKGICAKRKSKGKHIIISAIEHAAMLSSVKQLKNEGFEVSYLGVDEDGIIKLDELKDLVREDTIFVGIMAANNEMGAIQPIAEAAKIAKAKGAVFFTDAVQAAGSLHLDVKRDNIDMMAISAHKFYGPKGIGVLYVKNGIAMENLVSGGHQERSRRGGTTNVPLVVGMAAAMQQAFADMDKNNEYIKNLRDTFINRVEAEIPYIKLNGHRTKRLPNNANFSFRYIEGESILMSLDLKGIAVSSGSACSSGSLEPSHVLLAMGLPEGLAHGSIRFTFGKDNTLEDVDYTVQTLKEITERLRELSPLFKLKEGEPVYV